jgi:type II secretory pathway predicted ATPase ExeA
MFLEFYQMREQPFGVTPDPRYLYLGRSHREALASLFYGIEADRGFVALIAQPGLGKTTLTVHILEKLQRSARTVFLFQTQCNSRELLQFLLNDLGVDAAGMDMVSMNNKLNVILSREKLAGRRFVLAIDEAQNLDPEALETIRLLSNFETSSAKLLQILLIGQPQLAHKLASPALVQLQQRISVFARLEPFDSEETARYIEHRLQIAGYDGSPLFTPGALQIIKDRSQGIPRNINALCFSALSLGYAMSRKRIDSEIMREVVADRDVESLDEPTMPRRTSSAPVKVGPILSYSRPTSMRWLPRWALGAACLAVSISVGTALLTSSSPHIGRLLQGASKVFTHIQTVATSAVGSATTTFASGSISSLVEKSGTIPAVDPLRPSRPHNNVETKTVVVHSGDTLRQIALRTVGQYSGKVRDQIRRLNPAMTNPNHIEVGQKVRLPQPSVSVDSPLDAGGANTTAKE